MNGEDIRITPDGVASHPVRTADTTLYRKRPHIVNRDFSMRKGTDALMHQGGLL